MDELERLKTLLADAVVEARTTSDAALEPGDRYASVIEERLGPIVTEILLDAPVQADRIAFIRLGVPEWQARTEAAQDERDFLREELTFVALAVADGPGVIQEHEIVSLVRATVAERNTLRQTCAELNQAQVVLERERDLLRTIIDRTYRKLERLLYDCSDPECERCQTIGEAYRHVRDMDDQKASNVEETTDE